MRLRARLLLLAALAAASPAVAAVAPVRAPRIRVAPSFTPGSTLSLQRAGRLLVPAIPTFTPETQDGVRTVAVQLSPANIGNVSGEQAKGLSNRLFDGIPRPPIFAGDARADPLSRTFSLDRGDGSREERRSPLPPPSARRDSRLRDRLDRARLYWSHLRWYTVTHIKNLWPAYKGKRRAALAEGVLPSVSRPRAFMARMRVMGTAGPFYVLGFPAREDDELIAEARATFRRYFPGAGEKELAAFDAFTERARTFNAERRAASNLNKNVRDALIAASLLPVSRLAGYFDGLLRDEAAAEANVFQQASQAATLAALRMTVLAALDAEDPAAPGRIVGVILMGSFARGAATPTSDIDLQALTADGSRARIPAFRDRLIEAWIAAGLQAPHPISVHDFAYPPSKSVITKIHYSSYLIIAADPALEAALSRRPDEPLPAPPPREMTWRGRVWRALHFAVVYAATFGR